MDEEVSAFTYNIAPREKPGEWHQRGLKRALKNWEKNREEDFEVILNSDNFGILIGFNIVPSTTGQYGYDTGLHFKPEIEEQLLDEVEAGHLAKSFYEDWIEAIQEVIQEEQEKTMFSPKEYATFFAHRHPNRTERQNADALGVTVGTYRGKVGRVRSKLEKARSTLRLEEACPDSGTFEDWKRHTFEAPLSVIHRVDESRLPVNSISRVAVDGVTLDDLPLEEILRE